MRKILSLYATALALLFSSSANAQTQCTFTSRGDLNQLVDANKLGVNCLLSSYKRSADCIAWADQLTIVREGLLLKGEFAPRRCFTGISETIYKEWEYNLRISVLLVKTAMKELR